MNNIPFKHYIAVFEPVGLLKSGPWMTVDVTVPNGGLTSVARVERTRAIIDTGADFSGLSRNIIAKLKLGPVGQGPVGSMHDINVVNFYDVQFTILGSNVVIPSLRVSEIGDFRQGLGMLLGRDFLGRVLFIYDGVSGAFSITLHDDSEARMAPGIRIERSLSVIRRVLSGEAKIVSDPK